MSKLDCFLNPTMLGDEVKEVIVGKRFVDDKGNPATIKIKGITQADNNTIMKRCTMLVKGKNGKQEEKLDTQKYTSELVLACIVEPNFRDPKFVEKMGTASPSEAITKLFTVGEYQKLSEAVLEVMGLAGDDLLEQAKNS